MLGVQRDHAFARLPHIAEQELQKITFALPSVAKDEGAGVGLVRSTAVEVHDDVGAEAVPANEEALGIGFAGIVHGVQIGNASGRQDTPAKIGSRLPPVLAERNPRWRRSSGILMGAHQLGGYVPRRAQLFRIRIVQIHAAVDERPFPAGQLCQQLSRPGRGIPPSHAGVQRSLLPASRICRAGASEDNFALPSVAMRALALVLSNTRSKSTMMLSEAVLAMKKPWDRFCRNSSWGTD